MTIAALAPFRKPSHQPDDLDFCALYKQYQPQLIRYVRHHFGSRDAEEIAQEALTRALRSLDRDRSEAETWGWLVRVARNVAHDLARSRKICESTDDDEVLASDFADDALLPEPAALLDERRELVRQALKSLPATQRRILVLYEVDELNCPAIARLVGSNEYAVRKALQRARSRFAAEFRALGGGAFGSFAFWFRGFGRKALKGVPAAGASTALCVVAGTLAITVGIQPGPDREIRPQLAAPAARTVQPADVADSADRTAAVTARTATPERAPARATRSTERAAAPAPAPGLTELREDPQVHVNGPTTPLTPGEKGRFRVVVHTPVGRVSNETRYVSDDVPGPVCSLEAVVCWYEEE